MNSVLAHTAGPAFAWTFEPAVSLSVIALGAGYLVGLRRLRRRRSTPPVASTWRRAAFVGGVAAIVVALMSPLDGLSGELLSAHMGQHLVLVLLAAPLLVLSTPSVVLSMALPVPTRRALRRLAAHGPAHALRRVASQPLTAWTVHVAVMWAWHVPSLYEAAIRNEALHAIEHASFLGTALLFWWVLLSGSPAGRRAIAAGPDVLYAVSAGVQGSMLGALLTFATSPLYRTYVEPAARHGVSALQDQQLAGLLMWVPAGVVYMAVAAALFVRWLGSVEDEARVADQRLPVAVSGK